MAIPTDFPLFSGEDDENKDTESPNHWLCHLERCFARTTTDANKIYDFAMSLEPESVAEDWWTAIAALDKDTWDKVTAAFKLRWPAMRNVMVSITTKRELIRELKLKDEDVGKMTGEVKKRNYMHIIWANKVEAIWAQLDDKNRFLLPEIRQNLPQGIIDGLVINQGDEHDGVKFFNAVCSIQIDKVEHHIQELAMICDLMDHMATLGSGSFRSQPSLQLSQQAPLRNNYQVNLTCFAPHTLTQPTTPTTPYIPPFCRQAPPHTPETQPIQQPTPANTSPTNPFTDPPTLHLNNTFYQHMAQAPISPLAGRSHNSVTLVRAAAETTPL